MRSSKKRSLLGVNEHFESKRNDKVALLDSFIHVIHSMLLLEVKAVVVHNLNPRLDKVANKLLAVVILGVELTV